MKGRALTVLKRREKNQENLKLFKWTETSFFLLGMFNSN
jgi:hypothetical protein